VSPGPWLTEVINKLVDIQALNTLCFRQLSLDKANLLRLGLLPTLEICDTVTLIREVSV
jgi:hypothetical protein